MFQLKNIINTDVKDQNQIFDEITSLALKNNLISKDGKETLKSLDGKPTDLVVSIIVPEDARNMHLDILAKIAGKFSSEENLEKFKKLTHEEQLKFLNDSKNDEIVSEVKSGDISVIAVTSCPTGVAHIWRQIH
ncbi:MAG: PTS sugar transporter subunit IIA [Mycoplasma sp.]|nr:PTS sugar transporter subunit IIA [Mycoplasma sp.]